MTDAVRPSPARPTPQAGGRDAVHAGPRLVVRTIALPGADFDLLSLLPPEGGLAWLRGRDGIVAWGEAARFEPTGASRITGARRWWRSVAGAASVDDEVDLPGSGLVALVSFTFADDPAQRSRVVVPRVVVGRRGRRAWLTTIAPTEVMPDDPLGDGVFDPAHGPLAPRTTATDEPQVRIVHDPAAGPAFEDRVRAAVTRIRAGELDKVVLARALTAVADAPLDSRAALTRLARAYPTCWTFQVDGLFGATPELLVRLERGLVTSRVLAGTIRRTGDDTTDHALAGALARSGKDLEEHEYAVRSVAEALVGHCSSMNVPESPFVLHLPNVMHLATDVTGVAARGSDILGLAHSLHPSAAVCGTPRARAQQVIADLEGMDRGRYAGPVGWIGANGDGMLGIALRCAQLDPVAGRELRVFAGCGIVAGSDPAAELAESQAKMRPILDALGIGA